MKVCSTLASLTVLVSLCGCARLDNKSPREVKALTYAQKNVEQVVPLADSSKVYPRTSAFLRDINGDGLDDVLVCSPEKICYHINTAGSYGDCQFICSPVQEFSDISEARTGIGLHDVDKDCDLDLIVTHGFEMN